MADKNTTFDDLSLEELKDKITSEQQRLTQLKMNHTVSYLENPMQIRHSRREIARMKTELQKRQNNG